ncbi:MAG: nicotinate-nucleotide adenylyltransferase [Pyrinomonadaceae bacterium]
MKKHRTGIYGGTFDPVHNGHVALARSIADLFALDHVIFVPAFMAPHKRDVKSSPALARFAMLALATQNETGFEVSAIELEAPERPYTIDTLQSFCEELQDDGRRIFFLMGADSWEEIDTWRDWEKLLTMTNHIVATRPKFNVELSAYTRERVGSRVQDLRGLTIEEIRRILAQLTQTQIFFTDAVMLDISATRIRELARLADFATIGKLVPPSVADYIEKYNLYSDGMKDSQSDSQIVNK